MLVAITDVYSATTPLVVRGSGAGARITAAGVLGDMVGVAQVGFGPRTI